MRFLTILILLICVSISATAQSVDVSKLTGTVYDAQGSLVVGAKIIAVNSEGKKFETVTNDKGVYVLNLPFNRYNSGAGIFKGEALYDIIIDDHIGFQRSETKGFVFIPSQFGKMYFDIALRISTGHEPCGYAGSDCLPTKPIETVNSTLPSEKISPRPRIEQVEKTK